MTTTTAMTYELLGLKSTFVLPTLKMKTRLAYMNYTNEDGPLIARDHLLRTPLDVESLGLKTSQTVFVHAVLQSLRSTRVRRPIFSVLDGVNSPITV